VALSKLNDFENSCAAYEKAIELGDDVVTRLNFAITLYNNDEQEKAREHFLAFERLVAEEGGAGSEALAADLEIGAKREQLRAVLL